MLKCVRKHWKKSVNADDKSKSSYQKRVQSVRRHCDRSQKKWVKVCFKKLEGYVVRISCVFEVKRQASEFK